MTTRDETRTVDRSKPCVHYWIVEPAGGPTSGARCRNCGEERFFFNNPDAVTDIQPQEHRRAQMSAWKRSPRSHE
jgi:hypothetical protein